MRECIGPERLTLDFDTEGKIASIQPWPGETPMARSCLAHVLARAELSVPPSEVMSFTFDLADVETGGVPEAERAAPVSATNDEINPGPADPTHRDQADHAEDEQTQLRAALDGHAADILACTSTERVLVRAAWSDGAVVVTLGNELAGTQAEGCVRSVLGSLPTPTTAEGTLLHLIRAPAAPAQ
jgi:hypothetical protein